MTALRTHWLFAVLLALPALRARAADAPPPPPSTVPAIVDKQISNIEKEVTEAAEAMPEEKYNFTPENLKIPGSDFKGVRSFAVQVKHIATANYFIWGPITGEKMPATIKSPEGPEGMNSKAEILKFLKESYALGHRAAAMLTPENMLQPPPNAKSSRLNLATFGVAHAFDHYGQMTQYLRMNGIVPPASRKKTD
jgi:hypothetical protein